MKGEIGVVCHIWKVRTLLCIDQKEAFIFTYMKHMVLVTDDFIHELLCIQRKNCLDKDLKCLFAFSGYYSRQGV